MRDGDRELYERGVTTNLLRAVECSKKLRTGTLTQTEHIFEMTSRDQYYIRMGIILEEMYKSGVRQINLGESE